MIVAGIDYSLNSPGLCVWNSDTELSFQNVKLFVASAKQPDYKRMKSAQAVYANLHGYIQKPFTCNEERFFNLAQWVVFIFKTLGVTTAGIEGYSMAGAGRMTDIAEATGVLKYSIWRAGIDLVPYAPTTAKKQFSGKGNAKKQDMISAFNQKFGVDIETICGYNPGSGKSPCSDIVDATGIMLTHYNNLTLEV